MEARGGMSPMQPLPFLQVVEPLAFCRNRDLFEADDARNWNGRRHYACLTHPFPCSG